MKTPNFLLEIQHQLRMENRVETIFNWFVISLFLLSSLLIPIWGIMTLEVIFTGGTK